MTKNQWNRIANKFIADECPHEEEEICTCNVKETANIITVQEEYENLLKEWQERLFMKDWFIKIKAECSFEEMPLPDCSGCADWQEATKTAYIYILNSYLYGERIIPFDAEKTIVHELLHLKFSLLSDGENGLNDRYVHQLIDEMSRSLVDAKRSGR